MSDAIRAEGRAFAKFLESLPESERIKGNEIERRRAIKEHKEFQDNFRAGICYLCQQPLTSVVQSFGCLHWLLNPPGFKKDAVTEIASRYGLLQIQGYLRWGNYPVHKAESLWHKWRANAAIPA